MKLNSIHSKQFSTSAFHCYSLFIVYCIIQASISIEFQLIMNICAGLFPQLCTISNYDLLPVHTLVFYSYQYFCENNRCMPATSICTGNLLAFIDLTYMHIYFHLWQQCAKLHLSQCMSAPHKYVLHQRMSCNLKIYSLTCITNIELLHDW